MQNLTPNSNTTTNNNKNSRKRRTKNILNLDEDYEQQEVFLSEHYNKERMNPCIIINTKEENPIYSPKKPEKHYKDIINNNMEIEINEELEHPFHVEEGRNIRKNRFKNKNYINNIIEENYYLRSNNANKKKKDKKRIDEFNFNEFNNNIMLKAPQNKKKKDILPQKAKSRNERNPKNNNMNNTESIYNYNDKKEENKKKQMYRSCTTRNIKNKKENKNKAEKNKERKKIQSNKNKGKKEKINKEEKEYILENFNNIKNKSRSHLSNSIKDKMEKENEKGRNKKDSCT